MIFMVVFVFLGRLTACLPLFNAAHCLAGSAPLFAPGTATGDQTAVCLWTAGDVVVAVDEVRHVCVTGMCVCVVCVVCVCVCESLGCHFVL